MTPTPADPTANAAAQATDPAILERHIMDCLIAKSEAEHWAAREIERLREALAAPAPALGLADELAAKHGDLIRRVEYILDTTATARERLHRRAHLTNHDLRTILTALRQSDAGDAMREAAAKVAEHHAATPSIIIQRSAEDIAAASCARS